jgi:hypothetical protein
LESLHLTQPGSEREDGKNVLTLQVSIVRQDLLGRHARAEQLQDDLDRIPQMADARFAMADVGVDGNPFEQSVRGHENPSTAKHPIGVYREGLGDPSRDADDRGDLPEAIFWHPETALLFALLLPLLAREPLFHLAEVEEPEGYAVSAVYGEQGTQVAGWLRRYESRQVEALHLAEALTRAPGALADLLDAAGPGVGRILARREA